VADRTYALSEFVGTSKEGVDEAIAGAIARASKSIDHLDWFEVSQIRGYIRDGAVDHYQVTLKVGSRLEDM
jgi:flavin-binding protein dodecin